MIPYEWLIRARERIAPHIRCTPLIQDEQLHAWIKWDNRQVTGSFKARGALNKVFILEDWERKVGMVAASAGNHGQGLALAGKLSGASVIIFASEHTTPIKLDAMRAMGAEVRLVPGGYPEAETTGMGYANENHLTWVSPYNDGQVVAGQGTIALEILEQLPAAGDMTWLVPVSGGGLISGIGVGVKEKFPQARLVGVQAQASPFTHSMFYRGTQENVQDLPSLADGLTGAIESASVTIPMMRRYVDDIILVSEEEIARAVAYAWYAHGETIEGSGAVVLAALLDGMVQKPAVAIISGGNIQPDIHKEIRDRYGAES